MIVKSGVLDIFLLIMIVQTIMLICIFVRLGRRQQARYIEPPRSNQRKRRL